MLSQKAKDFSIESLLREDKSRHKEVATSRQETCPFSQGSRDGCHRLGCGPRCCHSPLLTQTDWRTGRRITAELCHDELWQAFHGLGTEMIITKTGRRMFPALRVKFGGLKPDSCYRISLYFVPIDQSKYRYVYHSSKWMVAGPGDLMMPGQFYEHSDSPLEGIHLDGQVVSFERIKLTNSNSPKDGQISLVSMQKFQPRIHITEVCPGNVSDAEVTSREMDANGVIFAFPQTSFMAVTAYQNQEITRLKIARNPFAKGFREAGKTRSSLDTIMASFGLTLSSKMYASHEDKIGHIKTEDSFDFSQKRFLEQTTPSVLHLPPTACTNLLSSPSLPWVSDPLFPPPPAHSPGLYSLELYSQERDNFAASMFLLQQHRFGLNNFIPGRDLQPEVNNCVDSLESDVSPVEGATTLSCSLQPVKEEENQNVFCINNRDLRKRKHGSSEKRTLKTRSGSRWMH